MFLDKTDQFLCSFNQQLLKHIIFYVSVFLSVAKTDIHSNFFAISNRHLIFITNTDLKIEPLSIFIQVNDFMTLIMTFILQIKWYLWTLLLARHPYFKNTSAIWNFYKWKFINDITGQVHDFMNVTELCWNIEKKEPHQFTTKFIMCSQSAKHNVLQWIHHCK